MRAKEKTLRDFSRYSTIKNDNGRLKSDAIKISSLAYVFCLGKLEAQ